MVHLNALVVGDQVTSHRLDRCLLRLAAQRKLLRVADKLNPKRTVAELKELRSFTADENGAQRVAFTKKWVETRAWLRKKLQELPVEVEAWQVDPV